MKYKEIDPESIVALRDYPSDRAFSRFEDSPWARRAREQRIKEAGYFGVQDFPQMLRDAQADALKVLRSRRAAEYGKMLEEDAAGFKERAANEVLRGAFGEAMRKYADLTDEIDQLLEERAKVASENNLPVGGGALNDVSRDELISIVRGMPENLDRNSFRERMGRMKNIPISGVNGETGWPQWMVDERDKRAAQKQVAEEAQGDTTATAATEEADSVSIPKPDKVETGATATGAKETAKEQPAAETKEGTQAETAKEAPAKEVATTEANGEAKAEEKAEATVYKVKSGDSIWRIAHTLGVDFDALEEANKELLDKQDGMIHPGNELIIPDKKNKQTVIGEKSRYYRGAVDARNKQKAAEQAIAEKVIEEEMQKQDASYWNRVSQDAVDKYFGRGNGSAGERESFSDPWAAEERRRDLERRMNINGALDVLACGGKIKKKRKQPNVKKP